MGPDSRDVLDIGGREITLPVRVRDGDQWSAQYLVSAKATQALVDPVGLAVVQLVPRRAMAMITFARYRDTDLGPYEELVISFLVRGRASVAARARRRPFRRARGETGIYPYRLAATRALAVEAGQAIWGYPRFPGEIEINAERGWARCSLAHDEREVMRIAVREGGPLKLTDPNLPNFSVRDGVLRKSPWEQQGSAHARLGGAKIELGSHSIANELRALGLPKRALMSATMRGLSATYGSPVDLSTAPADHGSSSATASSRALGHKSDLVARPRLAS